MPEDPEASRSHEAELKNALHRRLALLYGDVTEQTKGKYKPSFLLKMVSEKGGFDTACQLIATKEGTPGFWKLIEHKLPKLTVEYIALTGPWKEIIPPEVLTVARDRLKKDAGLEL